MTFHLEATEYFGGRLLNTLMNFTPTIKQRMRLPAKSKAWSELIEVRFSDAVRLSIHLQSCGAKKLGIRLIEPDNWQTPWHGVAVDLGGRFMLLKRAQAEALGGQWIHREGRLRHKPAKHATSGVHAALDCVFIH